MTLEGWDKLVGWLAGWLACWRLSCMCVWTSISHYTHLAARFNSCIGKKPARSGLEKGKTDFCSRPNDKSCSMTERRSVSHVQGSWSHWVGPCVNPLTCRQVPHSQTCQPSSVVFCSCRRSCSPLRGWWFQSCLSMSWGREMRIVASQPAVAKVNFSSILVKVPTSNHLCWTKPKKYPQSSLTH